MRLAMALAAVALLAGAGCQTFLGIEDAQQHLPRLDGNYLVAIERPRMATPTTRDTIRMSGTASLDASTRTLDLSLNILMFGSNTPLTETSITGIQFPDDSDETEVLIGLTIPAGAFDSSDPPPSNDLAINIPVRFIAEADYSFCAKPVPGQREATVGSILVESFAALPPPDVDCDDPLRD